jgi:hypothetical protein
LVGLGSFFAEILGIDARSIWILYPDLSIFGVAGAM